MVEVNASEVACMCNIPYLVGYLGHLPVASALRCFRLILISSRYSAGSMSKIQTHEKKLNNSYSECF